MTTTDETCRECGHGRDDHCGCGSVCMKCDCSRYRDENGIAPCPFCEQNDQLSRVEWAENDKTRATHRCVRCHGPYEGSK